MICKRCGLSVSMWFYGWRHNGNWHTGRTPAHRRHRPEPVTIRDDSEEVVAALRNRQEK
jgi:hypothetical protein